MKKRGRPRKITFIESFEEVEACVEKRRGKWFLNAISWISWEDIKSIILVHIEKKWSLWDQKRPMKPWLNRIISNQLKNLLRNYYGNFVKPCVQCPFNSSGAQDNYNDNENFCSWTKSGLQDKTCPLYKKWLVGKKSSFDINLAATITDKEDRITCSNGFNLDLSAQRLHEAMELKLTPKQFKIYEMLYILHLPHDEIAKKLGYISNEKGRSAGYKQIKNAEKQFKIIAKQVIKKQDIL
jgi:DNA-directed RNA polymerase specialized sigma24 family protein